MDNMPFFGSLDSKYAMLYVPALVYGFLSFTAETIDVVVFEISSVPLLATEISAQGFYQICTLICVIGGIYFHKIFRLIFGREGPSTNPKKKHVALKHMLLIITFVDFRDAESTSLWDLSNVFADQITFKKMIRTLTLTVSMGLTYILMYLSPILLYSTLIKMESPSILGVVLLITVAIFLAQNLLWRSDLSLVSPGNVKNIETPEYVRGKKALKARCRSSQTELSDFSNTSD